MAQKKKDNLNKDNLGEQLVSLKEKVRELRFNKANVKSKNTKAAKELKKHIARVLTEMNKYNKNK